MVTWLVAGVDRYKLEENDHSVLSTQVNELTRDLNFSKESTHLLGSRLRETSADTRNNFLLLLKQRIRFLTSQHKSLFYCNNMAGLMKKVLILWFYRILKSVLHNGNSFSSIPIGSSIQMKETHNNVSHLFSVKYPEHKCFIHGDLKVVVLVLGLQGGYTNYPETAGFTTNI